jgi:hypothetical protein
MAYTEADLTRLQQALARGTTRVTVDGKTVEYRSTAELREAIRTVRAELAEQAGAAPTRVSYATHRRD